MNFQFILARTSPILFPLAVIFTKLTLKLKTLSLNFDKIKLLKYLGIAIIFLLIFGFLMINANELTSKPPRGNSRYSWIGKLFYQKPQLLFIFSFIVNFFVFLLTIDLLIMLISKKMVLSKKNGIIYRNGKYFVAQNEILRTYFFESNKNSSIFIYLKSIENIQKLRETFLERLQLKLFLLINKNRIQIRLTFLENGAKNFRTIESFIIE